MTEGPERLGAKSSMWAIFVSCTTNEMALYKEDLMWPPSSRLVLSFQCRRSRENEAVHLCP